MRRRNELSSFWFITLTIGGILLIVAALVVLSSCSAPEHGLVIDKKYSAEWSYWDSQCMSYDKQGLCSLKMPILHTVPEAWYLCLRDGQDEGCRQVDQIDWHKYERGQQYP